MCDQSNTAERDERRRKEAHTHIKMFGNLPDTDAKEAAVGKIENHEGDQPIQLSDGDRITGATDTPEPDEEVLQALDDVDVDVDEIIAELEGDLDVDDHRTDN